MQEINGLVIKEVKVSDDSKIITVLTSEYGKLQFWTKGSRNYKSKIFSGTRVLCYSRFEISANPSSVSNLIKVRSSECLQNFNNISLSIIKTALSFWFLQLADILVQVNTQTSEILRLLLNCLYYLDTKIEENDVNKLLLIKLIFELRILSYLGMAPNLKTCVQCGSPQFLVDISHKLGGVVCFNCNNKINSISSDKLSIVIQLMRHAIESDVKKVFSVKVSDFIVKPVMQLTEKLLFNYLDIIPPSYKFLQQELGKTMSNSEVIVV